ncbi:hypothetical protein CAAN1_07S03180 [[Candida] anglica]|uniref:Topoisomerase I damage affected protein 2 n=1 Tax=[Candida] anglica TaxID=148631 RepID=A0ABP0ECY0_9ASCO
MSVTVTKTSPCEESPVSAPYLQKLLEDYISNGDYDNKEIIKYILENIQKKSSKHKFMVQVTRIDSKGDLNATTSFGAIWENSRDGYVSLEVQGKENSCVSMVTVYWIYI